MSRDRNSGGPRWLGLIGSLALAGAAFIASGGAAALQQTVTVGPGETAVVDRISVTNQSDQPANVALNDGTLDVAVPVQFGVVVAGADCTTVVPASNFARCTVTPGARLVLMLGGAAAMDGQPVPPTDRGFPPPPVGLARSGAGGPGEEPAPAMQVIAQAAFLLLLLGGTGVAIRRRGSG